MESVVQRQGVPIRMWRVNGTHLNNETTSNHISTSGLDDSAFPLPRLSSFKFCEPVPLPMAAAILQLSEIIASSVARLLSICEEQQLALPQLDEPYTCGSETFRQNSAAAEAASLIGAAALQLAATLLPPQETLLQAASGSMKSAALSACTNYHLPEILRREGGSQGIHVDAIASKSGLDKDKTGRLLRLLANRHIFREVSPNVFANNRISSLLDTCKDPAHLISSPTSKHDDTSGFVALVEMLLTDGLRSAAYLVDNLRDPHTSASMEPQHAALQRAYKLDVRFSEWMQQPDQEYRRRRLTSALDGVASVESKDYILKAYNWSSVPHGGKVVDVGGGIGAIALSLNRAHPELKLIIEDRAEVIADGIKLWQEKRPSALASGQVQFIAHDFFGPQPRNILSPSVFILRNVLHKLGDQEAIRLLTFLRASAGICTVLLILGHVMPSSLHDGRSMSSSDVPSPLLPDYGAADDTTYTVDMAMLLWYNSQVRTINHLSHLLEESGWRMKFVQRNERFQGGKSALDVVHASPS